MKRLLFVVATLTLTGLAFLGGDLYDRWRRAQDTASHPTKARILYYVDAMHPWYKSDKPGIAPDCGMKLTPVYADRTIGDTAASSGSSRRIVRYRDPKQPSYTSDTPGINPETGNDLEPVYAEAENDGGSGAIQISTDRQQLMGVRYAEVQLSPAEQTVRAVAKVAQDERLITRVHAKVDGWIEQVSVAFAGDYVRKDQPLLTIYSPDLLAVQQEYLLSLKARDVMSHSSMPGFPANSASLIQASRHRLELLDMSPEQIADLERTGTAVKTVQVFAPATGYVIARNAFPSERITPDTELYEIGDLSHVWVIADVFEADAPNIHVGQMAHINSTTDRSISFNARVSYIQPEIDAATRTWKVRMDVANPANKLKPEMYLDATFDIRTAPILQVPAEAVINSGSKNTVFVDRGNGLFEPRTVETGERVADQVQILSGLHAGERVVASGAFLLDSESQLKSSYSATDGGSDSESRTPVAQQRAGTTP